MPNPILLHYDQFDKIETALITLHNHMLYRDSDNENMKEYNEGALNSYREAMKICDQLLQQFESATINKHNEVTLVCK